MQSPLKQLEQSFLRTKAQDYASFMKAAALQANSSNNTIFADTKGEIAFLTPQFMPKRDDAVTCSNKCRQSLYRRNAKVT